jgi:hypothetical protein
MTNRMQRVLKKGVVKGFATWPPDPAWERMYTMVLEYMYLCSKQSNKPLPIPLSPMQRGVPIKVQKLLDKVNEIPLKEITLNILSFVQPLIARDDHKIGYNDSTNSDT